VKLLETARTRALWIVVGIAGMAMGVIAWTTLPAWPVVGVAVATLLVAMNGITTRLAKDNCLACGKSLKDATWSEHGGICGHCHQINPPTHAHLAKLDAARARELLEASREAAGKASQADDAKHG
jgi:hypothetical protein